MKKIYTYPEVEIIKLSANDVLAASGNVHQFGDMPSDDQLDVWTW